MNSKGIFWPVVYSGLWRFACMRKGSREIPIIGVWDHVSDSDYHIFMTFSNRSTFQIRDGDIILLQLRFISTTTTNAITHRLL